MTLLERIAETLRRADASKDGTPDYPELAVRVLQTVRKWDIEQCQLQLIELALEET